jgi:hypothetical protein
MAVILVPRKEPENRLAEKPVPEFEAGDLLEGAAAIAVHVFGAGTPARRGHTLLKRGLPHFRVGNRLFARKSVIAGWIAEQERTTVR